MSLKRRADKKPTDEQVAALADKMADKKYSGSTGPEKSEKQVQRSLALPKSLDVAITTAAAENKINLSGPQNASALIREAVEDYLKRRKELNS